MSVFYCYLSDIGPVVSSSPEHADQSWTCHKLITEGRKLPDILHNQTAFSWDFSCFCFRLKEKVFGLNRISLSLSAFFPLMQHDWPGSIYWYFRMRVHARGAEMCRNSFVKFCLLSLKINCPPHSAGRRRVCHVRHSTGDEALSHFLKWITCFCPRSALQPPSVTVCAWCEVAICAHIHLFLRVCSKYRTWWFTQHVYESLFYVCNGVNGDEHGSE